MSVPPNGIERRKEPRASLAGPCPCFFHISGKRFPAFLVDLSPSGAGFRNFESSRELKLGRSEETRFDVITPYGRGHYSGQVIWTQSVEGGHSWGLRLNEPVRERDGPLETLLLAASPSADA